MARIHIYSDESGDFGFSPAGSAYFMVTTATMSECTIGDRLHALRLDLIQQGIDLEFFHARDDQYTVRKLVYDLIAASDVRFDCTMLEKRKTYSYLACDHLRFYKTATYLHYKHLVPLVANRSDDLMVVSSSLQISGKKAAVHEAIRDVILQTSQAKSFVTAFHQNRVDPCLQIADYVGWAIQRKMESGDDTWFSIIERNVESMFEPYKYGTKILY